MALLFLIEVLRLCNEVYELSSFIEFLVVRVIGHQLWVSCQERHVTVEEL